MRLIVLACVATFLSGCGGSDLPELCTVVGKVTKDGQPVVGASVTFAPVDSGRPSSGRTDAEGNYKLMYNVDTEGAVVGKHKVTVISSTSEEDYEEASLADNQQETIDYQVEIEVQPGSNTMDIPI